jgi:hypothetical protein
MAQVVEYLSNKHKALSSNHSTPCAKKKKKRCFARSRGKQVPCLNFIIIGPSGTSEFSRETELTEYIYISVYLYLYLYIYICR